MSTCPTLLLCSSLSYTPNGIQLGRNPWQCAISDSAAPINITHSLKGSAIYPISSTTGVVHLVLPTAPNGNTTITKLSIDLASTEAHISKIQISYSDDLMYDSADDSGKSNLKFSNSVNTLDISNLTAAAVQDGQIGNGISVAITIIFKHADPSKSSLSIWSLGALFNSS